MEQHEITHSPQDKPKNEWANWALSLGLICILLGGTFGILPIITIIISAVGIQTASKTKTGMAKSVIGAIFGALYFLVYLNNYGHLR